LISKGVKIHIFQIYITIYEFYEIHGNFVYEETRPDQNESDNPGSYRGIKTVQ
jgi:hypothetical protein